MLKNILYGLLFGFVTSACLPLDAQGPGDSGQLRAITKVQGQASEAECANGGVVLDYGIDENGNGILDEDEVDGSGTVCHGEDGTDGSSCILSDNNDGTSTLSCPDGTSVTIESVPTDTSTILEGSFTIENALDLEFINKYTSITGQLSIAHKSLTTISLPNLESVGDLSVAYCETCTELSFPALTATGGDLDIELNPVLESISLPLLAGVGGDFIVRNNSALPTCQAEILRDQITEANIGGTITISGNDDTGTCNCDGMGDDESDGELPCDDTNACTYSDVCTEDATCVGTSYECNDGLDCTADLCDGAGGCTYEIEDGYCVILGSCYADEEVSSENSCKACNVSLSADEWSNATNGASCDDDNACTAVDVCEEGLCSGIPIGDGYEPNNSENTASYLGNIDDDASYPKATFTAFLYGSDDSDWYKFHVNDTSFAVSYPRADLKEIPADSDYELCAYYTCDSSNVELSCTAGTQSVYEGMLGCCSDNMGSADEMVRLDPNCAGSDDSGDVYVRVGHVSGPWTCSASYTLQWGDD